MHLIQGDTANEVWVEAARRLLARVDGTTQDSRGGPTIELLHVALSINDPRQRWILARTPALNPAFAIAEIVWMLNGRQDSAFLNYWNPLLPKFAGHGDVYYGAYGFRLRTHFGLDQIRRAYQVLRSNPPSRQVVLQIWDPRIDLPEADGTERAPDIPCNLCSILKVRNGRLEWVQIMRSNDVLLGLPQNIIQFTCLQEMMASWLVLEPGSYNHFSDSLHLYADRIDDLRNTNYDVEPQHGSDRWTLDYDHSMRILKTMSSRMDIMRQPEVTEDQLLQISTLDEGDQAAQNMLLIVAADASRRHRYDELTKELAGRCTDGLLAQGWQRWTERQQSVSR
jgi:thymidylate synthase